MENKPLSSRLIVIGMLAAVLFGVYFLVPSVKETRMGAGTSTPQVLPNQEAKHYKNTTYGIAFDYPSGYVLDEGERGDGHREHYGIVLVREEDSEPRLNSEGPTALTVDIYQNNLDKQTLTGWLIGSNQSNFKLSDGTYASTTIHGREAITYRWSGLYEGETTAFLHNDRIVVVSVTFMTPGDENIDTYKKTFSSLRLSEQDQQGAEQ